MQCDQKGGVRGRAVSRGCRSVSLLEKGAGGNSPAMHITALSIYGQSNLTSAKCSQKGNKGDKNTPPLGNAHQ